MTQNLYEIYYFIVQQLNNTCTKNFCKCNTGNVCMINYMQQRCLCWQHAQCLRVSGKSNKQRQRRTLAPYENYVPKFPVCRTWLCGMGGGAMRLFISDAAYLKKKLNKHDVMHNCVQYAVT